MAPQKVTKMVLDVDLKCVDCYKKVKKVICKIPEIRDQEYDVEKNKVNISVVCCSPDKIREKLCHKGGTSIQKIVTVVPDKPKPKPSPPSPSAAADHKPKPKEPKKPPKEEAPKKPADPIPKSEVAKMIIEPPVHGYPHMYPAAPYPMVYEGYSREGGPFQTPGGYGYGYGYGYERGYNINHGHNANAQHYTTSDYYFSEENPQGCSVM